MENPFKNGMIWGYHYFQKHPNEPLISQKRPDTCFHCFYLHRTCTKSGQNFRNKNGHLDGNEQNVPASSVLGQVPKYGGRRLKRSLGNNNLESSRSFRYKLLPYLFVILRVSLFFRWVQAEEPVLVLHRWLSNLPRWPTTWIRHFRDSQSSYQESAIAHRVPVAGWSTRSGK